MYSKLLLFFFFVQSCLFSQATLRLTVLPEEQVIFDKNKTSFKYEATQHQPFQLEYALKDSNSFHLVCADIIQILQEKAFLTASIDDFTRIDSTHAQARLYIGVQMHWVSLRLGSGSNVGRIQNPSNVSSDVSKWLNSVGFRENKFEGKPLQHYAILKLQKSLLETAENNGFPFAKIFLDSIEIKENGAVSATLNIEPNQYFTFAGIKNLGDLRLPKAFLSQFLGIQSGMPYSREKVLSIKERLRTLSFLELSGNPMIRFLDGEAVVNVFLKKKKNSRFDFIIGLLPQNDPTSNRLLLTGNLNASFQNALNLGERFTAEIERLRPETQKLDVQVSYPYLLGLPLGIDGHLNIFKRDSTWLDAFSDLGLRYMFEGDDYIKFFWENKSTSLLQVDTNKVRQTRRLPNNLDIRQNGLGIETGLTRLDFRFNPRKGWATTLKASAGFSNVLRNNQIENLKDKSDPEFSFKTLYDSVTTRANRYRLEGKMEAFVPLFKRSTFKIGIRGGAVISPSRPVFSNEQYRLGGNRLLRGFDEESLFATNFLVSTLEYRLLIGQYSYLSTFADYAYLENITNRNRSFLRPLGLGAGMTFETKAGIFGISLAVGKQGDKSFDFRAAKFHLGYVSLF
jgi:outer membrane protein assembly factor BamA